MTPVKRAINHAMSGVGGVGLGLAQEYASRGGVELQLSNTSYLFPQKEIYLVLDSDGWSGKERPSVGLSVWRLRVDLVLVHRRPIAHLMSLETRGGGRHWSEGHRKGSPTIWSGKWLTCGDSWQRCMAYSRQLLCLACVGQTR